LIPTWFGVYAGVDVAGRSQMVVTTISKENRMYAINCEATVSAELDSVWGAWADKAAYPNWDPR